MFRDKIIGGMLLGTLGNIAMDIFQFPIWKLKIIRHPLSHYAGSLLLEVSHLHQAGLSSFVVFLADYIYSALLGIVFLYLLKLTGPRFFITKGFLYGVFLWFASFGGLRSLSLVRLRGVVPEDALIIFCIHLIFGLTMGLIVHRFRRHFYE